MNLDEIVGIFGLRPASTAKTFMLGGEVIGTIPEIGLWLRLDTVAVAGESESVFPDIAKERPRRLIRWEYIRTAEIFEDRVETQRMTGYRPRAA